MKYRAKKCVGSQTWKVMQRRWWFLPWRKVASGLTKEEMKAWILDKAKGIEGPIDINVVQIQESRETWSDCYES